MMSYLTLINSPVLPAAEQLVAAHGVECEVSDGVAVERHEGAHLENCIIDC